jgi:hypothetical protein
MFMINRSNTFISLLTKMVSSGSEFRAADLLKHIKAKEGGDLEDLLLRRMKFAYDISSLW